MQMDLSQLLHNLWNVFKLVIDIYLPIAYNELLQIKGAIDA